MNLEREVKSSFDVGPHHVKAEYNRYWATMRISVDGELVLREVALLLGTEA